jgi:SpoVK/Ycf46/Vps4 family AAA+-type ATPase
MNNYKISKKQKFRSSTDINNYNNFLKDLDHRQKNKMNENTYTNKTPGTKCVEQIKETEQSLKIKDALKKHSNSYYDNECCNSNFNGVNQFECLLERLCKINNPDIYQSYEDSMPCKNDKQNKKANTLENNIVKKKITINVEINDISDLLDLIEKYPDCCEHEYNVNMKSLHKIKDPLTQLNNMIGMKTLKQNIVDQILFYIQNLHTLNSKNSGNDFMHTVIYGPPGTGKTEIAKIIGNIFSKIGILSKGTFKKVTRSDLIAGYLGQTALKTRDVIKDSLGGVLFIDEAYALGNTEKRDSFSKECIDTLCEALSDNKDNLMVIIAGYENDLDECFFNYNQGLNSRFTWRFKTDDYNAEDLCKIFIKKVNDGGWSIAENTPINIKWFEKNKPYFKFYGRDIETLFAKLKIAHGRRVFCLNEENKKKITLNDLENGFKLFLNNDEVKKRKDHDNFKNMISSMYV